MCLSTSVVVLERNFQFLWKWKVPFLHCQQPFWGLQMLHTASLCLRKHPDLIRKYIYSYQEVLLEPYWTSVSHGWDWGWGWVSRNGSTADTKVQQYCNDATTWVVTPEHGYEKDQPWSDWVIALAHFMLNLPVLACFLYVTACSFLAKDVTSPDTL